MGDDNEIRDLIRKESETFLERALRETKDLGQTYDFEYEFGRTKKNKSFLVVGATILTILILGVASIAVTRMIEQRTRSMPVDVRAFEDMNLKDLLDTAKRNESDKERATVEYQNLQDELKSGLDAADRDLRASLDSIAAFGLSADEQAAREKEARAAADAKKRELRSRLEPQIKAKKAQIDAIQDKIDQYDQKLSAQAKRQQEVLANERRLYDEEKKRLIASYESRISDLETARRADAQAMKKQRDDLAASLTARWNPVFDSARDRALIGEGAVRKALSEPLPFPSYLRQTAILSPEAEARIQKSYADFLYLSSKLRSIPYRNSVPPALARMEQEVRDSISAYRELLNKSSKGLEDRDRQIAELQARAASTDRLLERYTWSVSEFVRQNPEGGYILDPRDPENVSVALNPAVPVADGNLGYVFRTNERIIATLAFSVKDGKLRARVLELSKGERLMPFDPILIRLDASSLPVASPVVPTALPPAAASGAEDATGTPIPETPSGEPSSSIEAPATTETAPSPSSSAPESSAETPDSAGTQSSTTSSVTSTAAPSEEAIVPEAQTNQGGSP